MSRCTMYVWEAGEYLDVPFTFSPRWGYLLYTGRPSLQACRSVHEFRWARAVTWGADGYVTSRQTIVIAHDVRSYRCEL